MKVKKNLYGEKVVVLDGEDGIEVFFSKKDFDKYNNGESVVANSIIVENVFYPDPCKLSRRITTNQQGYAVSKSGKIKAD